MSDTEFVWVTSRNLTVRVDLGPRRGPLATVIPMTAVYALLLATGVTGNIATCFVIARNRHMRTATNFYLFSLAISDLLLLMLGLPQELYELWVRYPYPFGAAMCIFRGLVSESSTNASILTIAAFTVERYVAICHPLRALKSPGTHPGRILVAVWIVAALAATPLAAQYGFNPLKHAFLISTSIFFVVPAMLILWLYVRIGVQLRMSRIQRVSLRSTASGSSSGGTSSASTRAVVKMLVHVVMDMIIMMGHDNHGHDNHGHDNHGHDNHGSSGSAGQEPGRPSIPSPTGGKKSTKNDSLREIYKENYISREYVNPPADGGNANLAAARVDVISGVAATSSSTDAALAIRNWADCDQVVNPGTDDDFTVVKTKKRRRESSNSPTAATPSSNSGRARSGRRVQSSARSVPRAQEIPTTRAHITEARARQASSSEEHCVYLEHGPELQPFHYLRALDRLLGGTAGVVQVSKVNGHQLLGLANRGLAERLINNGLEVEGTLLRAFPFRKRAERITVSNLPFFVEDSAIINALRPFGRITSIAPKMMKAGPYTYTDGRREAFIVLHEGMTTERLPTRLNITIKGEAWPAYLSTGIKCSRCHGQGHRRANCPLLAGLANNTRTAPPTTPAGVPPPTTPAPPQRSAAQPPAPTPSNPAMEVCNAPPVARAALHSSAPRPSPPAAPAFPMEETPLAPPTVTPAPSLRTPGSREPAAPTPDVEMSIVEETLASFTSSAKNATRVDLDAFIEGHPSVSFAKTDALGLGREEVLDLLSSRTKAQRKGPLLSPPQCDALVGLMGQILDLRPGAASNLYKVLGQVKAELRTTPAVPPTPTLPAPWPAKPTPPALHGEKTSPDIATPPPPLSTEFIDACYDQANDIIYELSDERYSEPLSDIGVTEGDIVEAIFFPDDREPLLRRLSTQKRTTLAGIVSAASERARSSDPFVREGLRILSEMLPPPPQSVNPINS
ncbi:NMUR1 [Cordylochernes scorpioides]|uniref:NMUR1 n=1 Tax=Cordylochernes scorpioides TaxID=51811 RepID=A0ABY6LJ34_9ARAC|nr:NMUR1 [Cordylochernes scorpioides]